MEPIDHMYRAELLRRTTLFAGLPEDVLQALVGSMGKRVFAKGMVLYHKGSPAQRLYLIEAGQVRIFVLGDEGQEITFNIHGPNECFGELALLDGGPRSAGAVAMARTTTLTLEREDFLTLAEANPKLVRYALERVGMRLRHLTAYVESLTFLDIHGRLAAFLLNLAEHNGRRVEDGIALQPQLTQAELASCIAATRESVNKALGLFRDEGLIRLEGYTIVVLDPAALRGKGRAA
jgi:CRP-like cAMP-binding protein